MPVGLTEPTAEARLVRPALFKVCTRPEVGRVLGVVLSINQSGGEGYGSGREDMNRV